ncbi:unnamed protein product, partial [Prorocentrum cordatum]
ANVDALSKNGSTPLLVSAREGHTAVCDALLRAGADADDGGDKGWTPLLVSAGEGHMEVCQALLQYQANPHGFTGDGRYERSALQDSGRPSRVTRPWRSCCWITAPTPATATTKAPGRSPPTSWRSGMGTRRC